MQHNAAVAIHRSAQFFDAAADDYERARPDYPDQALAWLADRLGLRPGRTVLDLAAGTGKLTRLLVRTGARVVAVEPVAGMRARLTGSLPDEDVLDGTAEDLPLTRRIGRRRNRRAGLPLVRRRPRPCPRSTA